MTPFLPSVISSFPSELNLNACMFPRSVTQTYPEGSTRKKCVVLNMPWPHARRNFPWRSKTMIGIDSLRCSTYTLSCESTSTPVAAPHFVTPGGNWAQFSTS